MMSPAVLRVFLAAAFLGAFLRLAECHFPKMHLSNRLEPQMGLGGIPEGSPVRGGATRALQVTAVTPPAQEVRMGERLELECEAFGGPPPTIQWLRDGQPIGQGMDEAKSLNNLLSAEALNGLGSGLGASGLPKVTSNLVTLESGIAKVTSRLVIECALPVHRGLYSCAAVSGTDADVSPPATVYVEGDRRRAQPVRAAVRLPALGRGHAAAHHQLRLVRHGRVRHGHHPAVRRRGQPPARRLLEGQQQPAHRGQRARRASQPLQDPPQRVPSDPQGSLERHGCLHLRGPERDGARQRHHLRVPSLGREIIGCVLKKKNS